MGLNYWEDLPVGTVLTGDEVVADRDEMVDYAMKNDPLPFHISEDAAPHHISAGWWPAAGTRFRCGTGRPSLSWGPSL
jgi:acyl dehydratase